MLGNQIVDRPLVSLHLNHAAGRMLSNPLLSGFCHVLQLRQDQ